MRVVGMTVAICLLACAAAHAADIAAGDVLLKVEVQSWGEPVGMTPVAHEEASGGAAMSMAADAYAMAALGLQAGEYTLLFWAHAPAGDQDAFFVEIDGERTRLKGPIDSWGTIVHPFTVEEDGAVSIVIIGQEAGMTVDQMAVVRGGHEAGEIEFADVPGEAAGEQIPLDELPRLTLPCSLADVPEEPLAADEHTVLRESFDGEPDGVVGEHRWTDGPFGRALILDIPDGRFDVEASELGIAQQGTIEWWVKPREAAHVWWDQGWHYFLHIEPAQKGGPQIDLSRHPMTQLQLTLTADGEPYALSEGPHEELQMSTNNLALDEWHHMLVSWDLAGDTQYLWVLIDGVGMQSHFPRMIEPGGFSRIELCNTPSDWNVPYLPMDGAIDEVRISNVSVSDRLAE